MNRLLQLIFTLLFSFEGLSLAKEKINLTSRADPQSPVTRTGTRVVRELYRRLGYDVRIFPQPLGRSSLSVSQGQIDGEVCRTADVAKEFPDMLKTDIPIVEIQFAAFGTKPHLKISDWASLASYRLAFEGGLKYVENRTKNAEAIPASTREQAFQLLFKDRVDIVIMDRASALQTLDNFFSKHQTHPEVFELALIEKVPLYHLLNRRKQDLLPKVNHMLGQMQKEGFIQKSWQEETSDHKIQIRKAQDL